MFMLFPPSLLLMVVTMSLFVSSIRAFSFRNIHKQQTIFSQLKHQRMLISLASQFTDTKTPDNNNNDESLSPSISWRTNEKCWRPTVEDVERISWGKPAKKKGTGSRGVPHRLNHDEERKLFDQARRKGFLEVAGSGWRSQRRDAPLINTYRSLCDARGQVCIVLHKSNTGLDDELVIDLSPLRLPDIFDSVGKEIISYVDLPVESQFVLDLPSLDDEEEEVSDIGTEGDSASGNIDPNIVAWEERPIYQLNPYCISWMVDRSEGKSVGKKLATVFNTADPKVSESKKPNHVKHGKNRRSGGFGIG